MKENVAQEILNKVKADYCLIAADFDQTRKNLWPEHLLLKRYVRAGDRVLDLGCGNGRLRLIFQDVNVDYTGADNCQNFIELAGSSQDFKLPKQKFILSEMFDLPFADNSFDAIFCIAAFHHLPGKSLRFAALAEMKRVLKPGGRLVMTNWNRWQWQYLHYIIKYAALKIIGQNRLDFKDILIPWQGKGVERYYHAFTLGELKRLFNKAGFCLEENFLTSRQVEKKVWYLQATNIVTVAKKC